MGGSTIPANDPQQKAGQTFLSHRFVVNQDPIYAFAKVTEDEQFIHVDPERAAVTPSAARWRTGS